MSDGPSRPARARNEAAAIVASSHRFELPSQLQPRRLLRRGAGVAAVLSVAGVVVVLAPGLREVRDRLAGVSPGWLAAAVAFAVLSGCSYALMFRRVFCADMTWRTSWKIAWSELAVGSLLPVGGAGGLALGAWILHHRGMPWDWIARRSVAFFVIKSSVNFAAVVVLGALLAVGLVGPPLSLWLTAAPAAAALVVIAAVLSVRLPGAGDAHDPDAGSVRRSLAAARRALVSGTAEAAQILRSRDRLVVLGALGYWAWDNAVLWAAFVALGSSPPLSVIVMGYLIGQLGGLLPLPGGLGGIDGGLFATLVVYGAPAASAAAAVFAYRIILFWLPLIIGGIAFATLYRGLRRSER